MSRTGEDRILTIPNVLSAIRICLIPVFCIFILTEKPLSAFLIFIIASITDGIDGFVARHFNQTTKLGKILDPIADRGLILTGAICLCIVSRLPVWILVLVLLRDGLFLVFGYILLKTKDIRVDVIMLGKVATTFFYVGFAMLVLAWPIVGGLNIFEISWLPGFGQDPYYLGIFFVYIGIIFNIFSSGHYIKTAYQKLKNAK